MDGRGTWLYLCKQHGTWSQSQEPCLALSAGSGSGAGPCRRGPSSVVQPSLLQGTNLAGSVDLCCCIRIRTRTASPCKRRLECVWCGLHGDRYGLEHSLVHAANQRALAGGAAWRKRQRPVHAVVQCWVLGVRAAKRDKLFT